MINTNCCIQKKKINQCLLIQKPEFGSPDVSCNSPNAQRSSSLAVVKTYIEGLHHTAVIENNKYFLTTRCLKCDIWKV